MSDHADIVPFVIEDGLVKQGEGVRCATAIELALVAERNEARKALADYADVSGEQFDYDTLLSKYGEKARDVREYQGYARDLRARVTELEAAITEYLSDGTAGGDPIGPQWYIDCNERTKGTNYPGKARLARALAQKEGS